MKEPKNRFVNLIGKSKDDISEVKAYKTITLHTSRSFVFSKELTDVIKKKRTL